ncbi:MAG: hypothetical protein AAGI38_03445 [Bacteroidota bacterium]
MDERQHIRIDQYLSGEMTAEEQKAFERIIAQNPEVAAEVELQREITTAFQEPEVVDLEQKLEQVMRPVSSKNRFPFPSQQRWAVAATVLLVAGLAYFLFKALQPSMTPDELYLTYTKLPKTLEVKVESRSIPDESAPRQDSLRQLFKQIDELYQAEQSLAALTLFQQNEPSLSSEYPAAAPYIKGILFLSQSNFEAALSALGQVKIGPYAEPADWYSTMILLRVEGDTDKVRQQLRLFSGYENPFQDTAREIMMALESL